MPYIMFQLAFRQVIRIMYNVLIGWQTKSPHAPSLGSPDDSQLIEENPEGVKGA